ncbi:aspartate dehydrogenase [Herbaspirillum sp. LeCh32-8]|uniref:aspartate dehydrogenase n=1 Tax=Herbaspirillum sp. LeCh32-8 TaxID=2821356 RepID=UPI001AE4C152|nr:aspartate dehydrogenase [Herbaspirillum sp. LeCh32-8]MBP0597441.1 aspartate dehydrogenase [Herbaspirillum sp. LeCh32-8]
MTRIAIAGLGTVGHAIAAGMTGDMPGITLSAVATRNAAAARAQLAALGLGQVALPSLHNIGEHADIVIECGGAGVLREIAVPVLEAGRQLLVMSAGALLASPDMLALWERHRNRIHIPSGAIGGLDAVAAMAEGDIRSAKLVTRKPPAALRGVAWLGEQGIDPDRVVQPTLVFAGCALDAVGRFPANLNVAAALSLAGIGPQRTRVELWVDPAARGNCHAIEVESDSGTMRFSIEAQPSANPGTSSLAARSALALLRRMAT